MIKICLRKSGSGLVGFQKGKLRFINNSLMLRIPESSSGQAVRNRAALTAFHMRSKPVSGPAVHNLRNMTNSISRHCGRLIIPNYEFQ